MQKKIFVVLGMSRTGTSAIARSLLALGIDLGDRFIPGNNLNPKGFWEDKDIMHRINRGVSASINYSYLLMDEVNDATIDANPVLKQYKQNAISLLEKRFADTNQWGFKDPRTVTLMPFWHRIFRDMQLDDHYIITLRNPLAAAHSNKKFINCDLEEAMLIWVDQVVAAIEGTHDKKRVIVPYEMMLENPALQLRRMHAALALDTPLNSDAIAAYSEKFLDKRLRHHRYTDEEFYQHPLTKVAPLSITIYDLLKRVAADALSFDDVEFKTQWEEIKRSHRQVFALHRYVDNLVKRNKALSKENKQIRKSLIWKLSLPIRAIDDYFSQRRRKLKEEQRLKPVIS